jgi:AcrR family transcriptional regulator
LLDTAAALFWEKGYAATTTREIAALVGIQQASIYYHVSSKEDLLYQLGISSLEQLRLAVQDAVHHAGDPLERIRIFVPAHLDTLLRYQIRHVTVLTQLHGLSAPHRADVLTQRKRYAGFVRGLLEDAQQAGRLRSDIPPHYLYLALLNMLNWAVFWFRRDRETPVDEVAAAFRTIYLEGAMAGSKRPPRTGQTWAGKPRKRAAKPSHRTAAASTPERMLERAAALFSSKGYAATSTREIAAGLGMRKASLYYHIQTKEDLLHAICKWSIEQIQSDVQSALAEVAAPLDRIRALIQAHLESMLRDQDKHAAALAEIHLLSAARQAEVVALRDGYEDLLRGVLEQAQKAGVVRTDVPLKYLCLSLLGLLNRVTVWYRRSGNLTPDQLGQMFAELFLTGALASGGRPRRSP